MFADLTYMFLSSLYLNSTKACVIGFAGHLIVCSIPFIPDTSMFFSSTALTSPSTLCSLNPVATALFSSRSFCDFLITSLSSHVFSLLSAFFFFFSMVSILASKALDLFSQFSDLVLCSPFSCV